jgi:phage terminase Nu1 subunit (DNA packaging protein)
MVEDEIVPGQYFVDLLGVVIRTVQRMGVDGHLVKAPGRGNNFYKQASLKALIAWKDTQIQELRDDNNPELTRIKQAIAQADLDFKEQRNAKIKGELIPREEIRPGWARVVLAFRTAMMAVPSKAKTAIPKLTVKDTKILEGLLRDGCANAGLIKDVPPPIERGGPIDPEADDDAPANE